MRPSKRQLQWVIDKVIDIMIDDAELRMHSSNYVVNVYSHPDTVILPIRFGLADRPLSHIVLDYDREIIRDDCNGINDYTDFIRLNCDMISKKNIDYTIDAQMTKIISEKLRP